MGTASHLCARALLFLCVGFTAAALIAGCGGERKLTQNQYIRKVNSETAVIRYAIKSADEVRGNASLKTRRTKLRAAARDVREASLRIAALTPPTVWEDEHAELETSVRQLATALDKLSRASATDAKSRTSRYRDVQTAAERGARAINAINAQRRGGSNAVISDDAFAPPVGPADAKP